MGLICAIATDTKEDDFYRQKALELARVPKAQRELAYRWELDREYLKTDYVIPAWITLNDKQRREVRKVW